MKTISLCMIVKNEENVLLHCLESVKDKVNEIIIVDTGSTDSTLEIARSFTEKIFHFEWINDFSAARNESIKYATSDYILILDADEYVEDDVNFQDDLINDYDYFVFEIKNLIATQGSFKHTAVRLFRNHINLVYENRLHEHLNVIENHTNFTSGNSNNLIYHVGYSDQHLLEEKKLKRNLPLMELEVRENPNAYNLYNMGKTYFGMNEFKKAIKYFKLAYPLSHNRVYLPELLTKLSFALNEVGQITESLSILSDATVIFPNETEMKYYQGLIFKKAGFYKDAEICFRECITLGDQGSVITEGSGGYMARFQLSEMYEKSGRYREAYEEILLIMEMKVEFAPVIFKYLELTIKLDLTLDEVKQTINNSLELNTIERLQVFMDTLYGVRHPLLDYYLTKYKITAQPHVIAISKIYTKKYIKALDLWRSLINKEAECAQDIVLLAYLTGDLELLQDIQKQMNLSKKEMEIIKLVIRKESLTLSTSTAIERILIELCKGLIVVGEFDQFQILANQLIESNRNYKLKIGELLAQFRFDEIAIDILISAFKEQSNNVEVIRILGDLCYRNSYYEDAQLFYSKLLLLNNKYSSYERSFNLYEKINDIESCQNVKQEISKRFNEVNWARA